MGLSRSFLTIFLSLSEKMLPLLCKWSLYRTVVSCYAISRIPSILEIGGTDMNISKVSANGQITVPVEIRRALRLKKGDKILFSKKENGEIIINNSSLVAILDAQSAVIGSDYSEEEILADIMQIRYGEQDV